MTTWRPACSLEALHSRARLLREIRTFFADRGVIEVETPLLASATATDPAVSSYRVGAGANDSGALYLQSSPEYFMKRLLAAHAAPIYQISKAFRAAEQGRQHNPEFTLLEWYRPGFDHHRLMDELAALVGVVLGAGAIERLSYRQVFEDTLALDPFAASTEALAEASSRVGALSESTALERDACLDLLMALGVQPALRGRRVLVYDFPASQAQLARVRPGSPALAERFELFIDGIEIANGFHELTDAGEQRRRFESDNAARLRRGLPPVALDERLLAALGHGLPACAGVAVGVDRLLMLALGAESLTDVLGFPFDRI